MYRDNVFVKTKSARWVLVLSVSVAGGLGGYGCDDDGGSPENNNVICGNNILEPGEACDGTDVSGYTCASLPGFASGSLGCSSDCKSYVTSSCIAGNTINAASCSQSDVQAAIDSASDGDTVLVPAGECEWDSQLVVSKPIVLEGAGIDSTILYIYNFVINADGVRITGFTFDGQGQYGKNKATAPSTAKNFRIDHCKYVDYDGAPIRVTGYSSGLVDHCTFIDITSEGIAVVGDSSIADRPWYVGDSDGVIFFEDCDWSESETMTRTWYNVLDGNYGARWVFRHNSVTDLASNKLYEWLETHGFYRSDWGRGVLSFEMYENTFTSPAGTGWKTGFTIRGGQGVIFNNSWVGPDWDTRTEIKLSNDRSDSFCRTHIPPVTCCVDVEGSPCTDQISNLYIWGNTVNGGNSITVEVPDSYENRLHIQQDRDFFLYANPDYVPYPYPHPLTLLD